MVVNLSSKEIEMRRFLCCLAWYLGSILLLIGYWLCMIFGSIFLGPDAARRKCQPWLDKINALAASSSGKE